MRIIAGQFRGRTLTALGKGDAGAHLRPTTDRVRESLFNVLAGGRFDDPITNARVLDMFAGTGALGLEALSRGADHVTFLETGRVAQDLLAKNVALLGAGGETSIQKRDATRLGKNPGAPFDLIFMDPPYGKSMGEKALSAALQGDWIAPGALIVWEESQPPILPAGITALDARKYGDTTITIARA